ncbi:tRNA threonylcarbamoyladenosine dehydratase [bacterium]|nr:tRNA threonylcarbamoyladenosine dehydratase [bacterium]
METFLDPLSDPSLEDYRLHRRFDRMGRLVGDRAMKKLMESHVMVIGLGGVGSWSAESLARSGIGTLTLVDFDEVCITNSNRQLHALTGLVGAKKAEVLAERCKKINPQSQVRAMVQFYNQRTNPEIFAERPDYVIDAIDNVTAKCHLLAFCRQEGIPVVSSSGSAARMDPTQVHVADLAETEIDPLARALRRILRQQYGFPETGKFGIPTVYSREAVMEPVELKYDNGKGFKCVCPQGNNGLNSCDDKNLILGSASFVTGTFGLVCAAKVVRDLIGNCGPSSAPA